MPTDSSLALHPTKGRTAARPTNGQGAADALSPWPRPWQRDAMHAIHWKPDAFDAVHVGDHRV